MSSRIRRLLEGLPAQDIAVPGGTLSYRRSGQAGPWLVLLHGIGSGSGSWVQQLSDLGAAFRVVAWDAPGYGRSSALAAAAPEAAAYAEVLDQLFEALGVERAILVGHSLGALMAAAFARRWPDKVRGLVLADPAQGWGDADDELRESALAERLEGMARLGPEGLAEQRTPALLSPASGAEARSLVHWNMARLRPDGYAQAARMLANGRLADEVAPFRGPVLVLCGDADTITPPAAVQSFAQALPRASYAAIAGAGHASYVERPEAVNDLITSFAAGLP